MKRIARLMVFAIGLGLSTGACGGPTVTPPQPKQYPGPAKCILGTGVLAFVQLYDGYNARIIMGGQGGFHIWGSVLARYVNFKAARLHYEFRDEKTDALYNAPNFSVTLDPADASFIAHPPDMSGGPVPDGGMEDAGVMMAPMLDPLPDDWSGWGAWLGNTVFVPYELDAGVGKGFEYFVGRRIKMSVTLTDADGRTCADTKVIIPFSNVN